MILKIIFKKYKKYYFNIFLNKKHFQKQLNNFIKNFTFTVLGLLKKRKRTELFPFCVISWNFTLHGCLVEDEGISGNSFLLEVEAELVAELLAVESIDPYSSSILSNKLPFDNPSIFLLSISICCTLFSSRN